MMLIHYILLLVSVFLHRSDAKAFRYDYQYSKESDVWIKLHRVKTTWHAARKTCNLEGATLASPLTAVLTNEMIELANNYNTQTIHIGVHSTFSDGIWHSIEGVFLPRFTDYIYEMNFDSSKQNCAVLDTISGSMTSSDCSELHSYICYKRGSELTGLTQCGTIDRGYELSKYTRNCYKFHGTAVTWYKAHEICYSEGAYLTIINSETEAEILRNIFEKNKNATLKFSHPDIVSVGFLDWEKNKEWYTVHGERLENSGYSSWKQGEPNGVKEFCGSMYLNGQLNDISCEEKSAFICEKDYNSLDVMNNTSLIPNQIFGSFIRK